MLQVMLKMSENLEIPDWFKELRVTAQESSDHLPVRCKVEWKKRTKNNSKERQKMITKDRTDGEDL